jgi:TolB protein
VFVSERDGNGEIYIMNDDGSDQTRLTFYEQYDATPSFSPDGSKIVFARSVPYMLKKGFSGLIYLS